MPSLIVDCVSKVYRARAGQEAILAVDAIDFSVERGEILGLLGPNGAGKTTTIKMIAGLVNPTSGRILVGGRDVSQMRRQAVARLGAVLEGNRNLHWKLTAAENLLYFGALKGAPNLKRKAADLLERLELASHATKRVGELSRGLQQRVAIAIALVAEPEVLLLDEPTLGLDVVASAAFKDIVRGIAEGGCAIVLTTHQMEVAQALSNRIAIVAGGRLAALDSLEQLMAAHRTPGYALVVRGSVPEAVRAQLEACGAGAFELDGANSRFTLPEGDPGILYAAMQPLQAAGLELLLVQQQEVNLEDVYRRVVGGTPATVNHVVEASA